MEGEGRGRRGGVGERVRERGEEGRGSGGEWRGGEGTERGSGSGRRRRGERDSVCKAHHVARQEQLLDRCRNDLAHLVSTHHFSASGHHPILCALFAVFLRRQVQVCDWRR